MLRPERDRVRWTDGLVYLEQKHGWKGEVLLLLARLCLGKAARA